MQTTTTQYKIETLYHPTELTDQWIDDAIGENAPRTYEDCLADVLAFRAGECGPDLAEAFGEGDEGKRWRIVVAEAVSA
jgi:hypothetical protein